MERKIGEVFKFGEKTLKIEERNENSNCGGVFFRYGVFLFASSDRIIRKL